MTEKIPEEFKEFQKYYVAYELLKLKNKSVSQVMLYTFIDFCLEKGGRNIDKKLKNYIQEMWNLCEEFPQDGPQATQDLADEIFQNLTIKFQSGILTTEMANQYFLCSILYSVLGGSENAEKEDAALFASIKINTIIQKGKDFYLDQNQNGKLPLIPSKALQDTKTNKNSIPHTQNRQVTLKFPLRTSQRKIEPKEKYDRQKAIDFLSTHHYQVPQQVPDPSHSYDSVLIDIQHAIDCLKSGDTKRGQAFLKKARIQWVKQ